MKRINTNNRNDNKNSNFIMLPKVDYCFKELMKDIDVLKGFLAAVLDIEVKEINSVEQKPLELRKNSKEDKYGILDVRVNLNNDKCIDMEIQVLYFKYWRERSLYYLSKMVSEQLKEGDDYKEFKKCIHIGILNFKLFKDSDEFYSRFHFAEDKRHEIYSDKMEIHILELPKLKTTNKMVYEKSDNSLYDWCEFFNIENEKELNAMYGKNEYIDKACDQITKLSADEIKKIEYDRRFKALCDYTTLMNSSYEDGVDAGIEQGIEQGIQLGIEQQQQAQKELLLKKVRIKYTQGMIATEIADQLMESLEDINECIKIINNDTV